MKKNLPVYIPILFFIVTTSIFFGEQLFGDMYFWEDFTEYVYPMQTFAARESSGFTIPFWNPYIFSGMPFFADLQTGFLYPLNRVLNLFVNTDGTLPVEALQFVIILHFFIAQLSMFFLMKYLKVNSFASVFSSVTYAFSSLLVFHVIHPMMVYHLSWFPLVLMFFLKAADRYEIKPGLWGGLILGLSMLSGHPQTAIYQYFFLGILFLWLNIRNFKNKEKSPVKALAGTLAVFAVSFMIFTVQYLPSNELAEYSQRKEMSYEKASEGSMEFKQIMTSVIPKFFGAVDGSQEAEIPFHLTDGNDQKLPYYYFWDTAFYFGLAGLILGLFGMIKFYRKGLPLFLIIMALFGFLYSLGENSFLHGLFYNLPFFGSLRMPARMMIYVLFGFSIMSGLGLNYLMQDDTGKKDNLKLLIAGLIPGLLALLTFMKVFPNVFSTPEQFAGDVSSMGLNIFISIAVLFLILYLILNKKLNTVLGSIIVIVFAFADLYIANSDFNKSEANPEEQYKISPQLRQTLQTNLDEDPFRVKTRLYEPRYMAMKRNQGCISQIRLMEGYNPLVLERVNPPQVDPEYSYDLLNVNYMIDIDMRNRRPYFRQNPDRLGNVWFVNHKTVLDEVDDLKKHLNENYYDLKQTVTLEKDDGHKVSGDTSKSLKVKADIIEFNNNSIKYSVDAPESGYLCMSEIWYPNWKAEVNGNEAEVLRANYSLRAVPVEKGQQTVEVYYSSSGFSTGLILALIAIAGSVLGLIFIKERDVSQK